MAAAMMPLWTTTAMSADQIEEIVITAQKRAENLQKAPIAVTAFNKEALDARGITNAIDLSGLAPNLNVSQSTSGPADMTIAVRGITQADAALSLDSPVGVYVDGVIQARIAGAILDLVDLERVEVLRGPQGTLYGRNTTGGAINFITKRPADDFGVEQKLGYGTYNKFTSRTSVNTGKIWNTGLKANLAFLYNQQDGYFDNTQTPSDRDPGADNTRAFRGELMFDQGGAFKANYSIYYVAQEPPILPTWLTAVSPGLASALVPGTYLIGGGRRDPISISERTSGAETYLHNLTLEWNLSDALTMKAITGYRHFDDLTGPDLDGNCCILGILPTGATGTVQLYGSRTKRQQEQFSQELQFVGELGGRFNYVIGGYYFTENGSERSSQFVFVPGPIPPFVPAGRGVVTNPNFAYNTEADSWAIFGQTTYTPPVFDDKFSATLGLRYTEDTKSLEKLNTLASLTPVQGAGHQTFNNLSYSASLDYQITDDILVYARHSTGYKAGGFNPRSAVILGSVPPYDEETIEAYEIGLKAQWLNRRLQTNFAAFYNKYRNLQISSFVAGTGGASTIVNNAGKAHYQGIELEVLAVPAEGITLSMSLGYVDPQYDQYITTSALGLTEDVATNADFSYMSEVTASAGIQYDSQPLLWIAGGRFQGRLDILYQSAQTWHPAPVFSNGEQVSPFIDLVRGDARTIVNGRISLREIPVGSTAATAEIALWGKNMLDEAYIVQGIDFGSLGFGEVTYGPPRTGGLEVTFRY